MYVIIYVSMQVCKVHINMQDGCIQVFKKIKCEEKVWRNQHESN